MFRCNQAILFLALAALFFCSGSIRAAQPNGLPDDAAAVVGDVVIEKAIFYRAIAALTVGEAGRADTPELRKKALDEIVSQALLLEEGVRRGLHRTDPNAKRFLIEALVKQATGEGQNIQEAKDILSTYAEYIAARAAAASPASPFGAVGGSGASRRALEEKLLEEAVRRKTYQWDELTRRALIRAVMLDEAEKTASEQEIAEEDIQEWLAENSAALEGRAAYLVQLAIVGSRDDAPLPAPSEFFAASELSALYGPEAAKAIEKLLPGETTPPVPFGESSLQFKLMEKMAPASSASDEDIRFAAKNKIKLKRSEAAIAALLDRLLKETDVQWDPDILDIGAEE